MDAWPCGLHQTALQNSYIHLVINSAPLYCGESYMSSEVTMLFKEGLQPLISIALLIEMRLRDTYGLN